MHLSSLTFCLCQPISSMRSLNIEPGRLAPLGHRHRTHRTGSGTLDTASEGGRRFLMPTRRIPGHGQISHMYSFSPDHNLANRRDSIIRRSEHRRRSLSDKSQFISLPSFQRPTLITPFFSSPCAFQDDEGDDEFGGGETRGT